MATGSATSPTIRSCSVRWDIPVITALAAATPVPGATPVPAAIRESSGGGSYVPHYQGAGSLRLKIKPADAKVYIDGYYVGMVDSFDGVFQKLNVDAGPHKVELRADGYQTTEFDVVVTPGDTATYKGDMKRK